MLEGIAAVLDAVAWPGVVAFAVWWLREPVTRLIDRINKGRIGPTGGEFETLPPAVDQQKKLPESPAEETRELIESAGNKFAPPAPDPIFTPIEEATQKNLDQYIPGDRDAQFKWLLRLHTNISVEKGHEENYRLIFGSQLIFLFRINQSGGVLPLSIAREAFADAVNRWPDVHKGRTLEQWLGFLIHVGLAQHIPPNVPGDEGGIAITPIGKHFLMYVLTKQLPVEKAG